MKTHEFRHLRRSLARLVLLGAVLSGVTLLASLAVPVAAANASASAKQYCVASYAPVRAPQYLSFGAGGVLFAGNQSDFLGGPRTVPLHRIGRGGAPVGGYGPSLSDPDAVFVDVDGSVTGEAGTVIAGASTSSGRGNGLLYAISPDGSGRPIFGTPDDGVLTNVGAMLRDSTGRLLIADTIGNNRGGIYYPDAAGTLQLLFANPTSYTQFEVDENDRIYTVGADGLSLVLREQTGAVVPGSRVAVPNPVAGLAYGPALGGGPQVLYVATTAGELFEVDAAGTLTSLVSGAFSGRVGAQLTFGPDGYLYLASTGDSQIYVIGAVTHAATPGVRTEGTDGNDVILGTSGTDTIVGNGGNDLICGRGGDDYLFGNGGNDIIDGGLGDDRISGNRGRDTINGGPGDDLLLGSGGRDVLRGGDGADRIYAGGGDDLAYGQGGDDRVAGNNGDDLLNGGAGADTLQGGSGTDTCVNGSTFQSCP